MFKSGLWKRLVLRTRAQQSLKPSSKPPTLSATSQPQQTTQPTSNLQLTQEEQRALLEMLLDPTQPLVSAIRKVLEARRDRWASEMVWESRKRDPSVPTLSRLGGKIDEDEGFFKFIHAAAHKKPQPVETNEGNV